MTLNLSRPSDDWTPDTPTPLERSKGYLVTALGLENGTRPVYVAPGTLDALVPGSIYTADSESSSELAAHTTAELTTTAEAFCG